jgi:hypothetical protein
MIATVAVIQPSSAYFKTDVEIRSPVLCLKRDYSKEKDVADTWTDDLSTGLQILRIQRGGIANPNNEPALLRTQTMTIYPRGQRESLSSNLFQFKF